MSSDEIFDNPPAEPPSNPIPEAPSTFEVTPLEGVNNKVAASLPAAEVMGMSQPIQVGTDANGNLNMLMDVGLLLTVELGRSQMSIRQVLDLQKGSVIELDRVAGDSVDIFINDRLIGRGDVVVVDDKFGVRITELVSVPVGE